MLSTLLGKVKPILISKRSTVYGGGREREGGGGVRGGGLIKLVDCEANLLHITDNQR